MTAIFNLGRANLPAVLEVEGACGPPVWAEDDFLSRLRDKNCILFFTEDAGGVATGYMSYRLAPRSLFLERIAVHPGQRRRGHGSALLRKLRSKMDLKGRKCVLTEVDEANTGAHLGPRALRTVPAGEGGRAVAQELLLLLSIYER